MALNDGTGHFSSASNTSSPGLLPLLALADLNGDGKLDIAQVTLDGTVTVRLGNGNGTFGANTSYSAGSGVYQTPKVIDVTGDGVLDIVVGSTVLPGNGNGTFGTAITTNSRGQLHRLWRLQWRRQARPRDEEFDQSGNSAELRQW